MARVINYYVHPGQRFSRTNTAMALAARAVDGISFVDLYPDYPRHDIDVVREQQRLLNHDVIIFQFPLYWYSTPSLLKEWQDLVLQHGFAYGHDGNKLSGKIMMLAITAGAPEEAYTEDGFQNFSLRSFLAPLEQTARLCKMRFATPYVLYSALSAETGGAIAKHAAGYAKILVAQRDDLYDFEANGQPYLNFDTLPVKRED